MVGALARRALIGTVVYAARVTQVKAAEVATPQRRLHVATIRALLRRLTARRVHGGHQRHRLLAHATITTTAHISMVRRCRGVGVHLIAVRRAFHVVAVLLLLLLLLLVSCFARRRRRLARTGLHEMGHAIVNGGR